jgi:hypothetical protein
MKRQAPKQVRREIFVLTPEEKRTICFVLIAFVLGLGTKHYRETHLPSSSPIEVVMRLVSASPHPAQKRVKKDPPQPSK